MARFKINIEIPLFLGAFGSMLSAPVKSNFMIYRTCYVLLGYNRTECALLGSTNTDLTRHLEALVEPEVTIINMVKSAVESSLTIFICMFIGPWSDKFGRKPIIIASTIGSTISAILLFISSCFPYISPWIIISCSIPEILMGGGPAIISIILSYISDITSDENRGFRLGFLDMIFALSAIMGSTSSSYVFNAVGYPGTFGIDSLCHVLGILYVIFLLPESLENRQNQGKLRKFFSLSSVKDITRTPFRKRINFNRAIILLILSFSIVSSLSAGDGEITFLYLRAKFGWTLQKYTLFGSAVGLISMVGGIIGIYFLHKLLKVTESVLILMGLLSNLNGSLLMGLASNDFHIFIAGAMKCLGSLVGSMMKSLLSKLVPGQEIGKLFSLMMIFAFMSGLGASPLYNIIYKDTLTTDPGVYNFLTAALCSINILTIILIRANILGVHYESTKIYPSYLRTQSDKFNFYGC